MATERERRIVELVLEAKGEPVLERIAGDLREVKVEARAAQAELASMGRDLGGMRNLARNFIGAFVGIQTITAAFSALTKGIDELAEHGNADAIELQRNFANLKKEISEAAEQIVAGMLPALAQLSKGLAGVTTDADAFKAAGEAIGDVLISITGWFVRASAETKDFLALLDKLNELLQSSDWQNTVRLYNEINGMIGKPGVNAQEAAGWADQVRAEVKARKQNPWVMAQNLIADATTGLPDPEKQKERKAKRVKTAKADKDEFGEFLTDSVNEATNAIRDQATAISEIQESYGEYAGTIHDVIERQDEAAEGQRRLAEYYSKENAERIRQLAEEWEYYGQSIGEAVSATIEGTVSITRAIKQMFKEIIAEFIRSTIIRTLFSAFNLGGAPSGTSAGFDLTKIFKPQMSAKGDVVTSPTGYLYSGGLGIMGEAGPEVIAPLKRDASGNMGVGAIAPVVNIHNHTPANVAVSQARDGSIDVRIAELAPRIIADEIRRGGGMVAGAMESTYRVNRGQGVR